MPLNPGDDKNVVIPAKAKIQGLRHDLDPGLRRGDGNIPLIRFQAMGSPCEVLVDSDDPKTLARCRGIAESEAKRIESHWSRYLPDSITSRINASHGAPVTVDEEISQLLDYAQTCFEISEGLFDITTGVLRGAWSFKPGARFPSPDKVAALLKFVGWSRVTWRKPRVTLPAGMEIDLGGIGKEYAVDRVLALLRAETDAAVLVNFGGDIAAGGKRRDGGAWSIGIEQVDAENVASRVLQLRQGGLTTSGDARRFILHEGKRYGHILDPRTGYPVDGAPRSVTVAADTCSEAGFLSTLGMLKGPDAESFLQSAGVKYWNTR